MLTGVDLSIPVKKHFNTPHFSHLYLESEAYFRHLTFVARINKLLGNTTLPAPSTDLSLPPYLIKICNLLDSFDKLIEKFPPVTSNQRFGNQSFATWHAEVKKVSFFYSHTFSFSYICRILYQCWSHSFWNKITLLQ